MKEILAHLLTKMASGRWILTVTCAAAFVYATVSKLIPPDAVVSILTMVFVSYFHKSTDQNGGQQK